MDLPSSTGFWNDRSRPTILGATLTVPLDQGYYLVTFLALLVSLAGVSFWNLTALFLHRFLARGPAADMVGLAFQVALRNLGTPAKVALGSIKLYHAWAGRGVHNLGRRTLGILVPAAFVWVGFAVASVFVSRVAITSGNGDDVSPIQPGRCGLWSPFRGRDIERQIEFSRKVARDTIQARNYVSTFYNQASVSAISRSPFKSVVIPIQMDTSAPCPFPNPDRCQLGRNGGLTMKTPLLNSHEVFGINSYPADQITFQYEAACSPIRRFRGDFERHTEPPTEPDDISRNFSRAFFGPSGLKLGPASDPVNWTYQIYEETINTQTGYLVEPFYARLDDPSDITTWIPTADFNRTDADVNMFFLSQNNIRYMEPTLDPWFLANSSQKIGDTEYKVANFFINPMACTEQFKLCNPAKKTDSCLPATGLVALQNLLLEDGLAVGFNAAQLILATRILTHMTLSTLHYSVQSLRGGALWANSLVYGNLSPSLPENQWRLEALGWFQTSLVKLQSYVVEFANNAADLHITPPIDIVGNATGNPAANAVFVALEDMCSNQLVRTGGKVQSFSFLGLMAVVCSSVLVIAVDAGSGLLTACMNRLRRGRRASQAAAARQADNVFHLLRLAMHGRVFPGGRWVLGRWDVPVLVGDAEVPRPYIAEDGDGLAVFLDAGRLEDRPGGNGVGEKKTVYCHSQTEIDSLQIQDGT
ncbi:hypothetical protein RB595_007257 [Gaeumannomyces hyphopodioides]